LAGPDLAEIPPRPKSSQIPSTQKLYTWENKLAETREKFKRRHSPGGITGSRSQSMRKEGPESAGKTLYVENIPFHSTEEDLYALFESYGTVEHISMPRDAATVECRGFAFVEMQDENAAVEAIRALNGSTFRNRTPLVNKARPRRERIEPRGNGERRFGRS